MKKTRNIKYGIRGSIFETASLDSFESTDSQVKQQVSSVENLKQVPMTCHAIGCHEVGKPYDPNIVIERTQLEQLKNPMMVQA